MDMLTDNDLWILMKKSDGRRVSVYMPTHRMGQEIQQDSIRLKNLLGKAENRLVAGGLRTPDVQTLLEPARDLLSDDLFWQHQSDGLAIFLSSDGLRYYRLPLDFEPVVVVGDRFHVKPLLPLLSGNGRFYILALSQQEVRLLQGTRFNVSEIELEKVPAGLAQALRYEDAQKTIQFHTSTTTPGGRGERPAIFHGQGTASADEQKEHILRYFRQVDEGLHEILVETRIPLVLAGVEYLLPLYREANTYPHLVDEGIEGNPEQLRVEELHARAWSIVEPLFLAAEEEAAGRYRQLAGSGSEQASDDLTKVVPAAYVGRVEELFVARDAQRWGTFDPANHEVQIHDDVEPGKDLLDFAAIHTFLNRGAVYATEPEQVPSETSLAAVFRY